MVMSDILAPGYVKDVRNLIQSYIQEGGTTLDAFKRLWKARGFSFIHDGCPRLVNPRRYFQILVCVALGFLQAYRAERRRPQQNCSPARTQSQASTQPQASSNSRPCPGPVQAPPPLAEGSSPRPGASDAGGTTGPEAEAGPSDAGASAPVDAQGHPQRGHELLAQEIVSSAAGAIFTVHCLYYTQHCDPRTLIYVAPEDLDALTVFLSDAGRHHGAWDAVRCVGRLEGEGAFLLGAVPFRERDVFGCTEEEAAAQRAIMERQLSVMKDKLFSHMPLEDHFSTDLVEQLGIKDADRLAQEYEAALRALPAPPQSLAARAPESSALADGEERGTLFARPCKLLKTLQDELGA